MSIGIDTVGVAVPVRAPGSSRVILEHRERFALPRGGFVATGIGGMAWIEASLPKRLHKANVEPLPVDQVTMAVRDMVTEGLALLGADPEVSDTIVRADGTYDEISVANPRVVRLDLVRDFHLRDPSQLSPILDGLAMIPQNARHKVRRFSDGRTGQAETLRVGPGSWAATLYDKHKESGGLAPPGSLRAEFRLRGKQLSSQRAIAANCEIRTLKDVSPDSCQSLRSLWWDLVGFGNWVGGSEGVWTQLRDAGLSDRECLFFVGWAHARRDRVDIAISEKTERRFRRLLRQVSFSSSPTRVRLNFESGEEEVAA